MGNHNFHIYIYIPNICVCYYKWDILTIPLFFNWQEINIVYLRYISLSDKPILLSYYLLIGINKSGLLRKNTPYIYNLKKMQVSFPWFPLPTGIPARSLSSLWELLISASAVHPTPQGKWLRSLALQPGGGRSRKRTSCRFAVDCLKIVVYYPLIN